MGCLELPQSYRDYRSANNDCNTDGGAASYEHSSTPWFSWLMMCQRSKWKIMAKLGAIFAWFVCYTRQKKSSIIRVVKKEEEHQEVGLRKNGASSFEKRKWETVYQFQPVKKNANKIWMWLNWETWTAYRKKVLESCFSFSSSDTSPGNWKASMLTKTCISGSNYLKRKHVEYPWKAANLSWMKKRLNSHHNSIACHH